MKLTNYKLTQWNETMVLKHTWKLTYFFTDSEEANKPKIKSKKSSHIGQQKDQH